LEGRDKAMSEDAQSGHAAIGFRVKSGSAVAVLVAGPLPAPQVLDRRVLALCDPDVPESRQPYHARMGTLETDERKVERRRQIVSRSANRSVSELIKDYRCAGHLVRAAALVIGSDYARAADVLRQSEDDLKKLVTKLGRSIGGPWRSDEKTATLAALLNLL
jgi:hypothetical protein